MEAPELYHQAAAGCDQFMVEDLLDFSNDTAPNVDVIMGNAASGNYSNNDNYSTTSTAVESCNSSSLSGSDHLHHSFNSFDYPSGPHFSNDLSVPYDEMAELEWLSNFVEESFSSEDLEKLHLISGLKVRPDPNPNETIPIHVHANTTIFDSELSVPARARSKRSRAAPMSWASRLLVLSSSLEKLEPEITPAGPTIEKNPKPPAPRRRRDEGPGGGERKCLHCSTDKTPQWRTGPMGPKTLCNACGVRYKSGRLVPEYRPAASPTFVLTKHSNSHRKVMELRRQKELMRGQQQQFVNHQSGGLLYDVASSNGGDDFFIHQHVGPDFGQLM